MKIDFLLLILALVTAFILLSGCMTPPADEAPVIIEPEALEAEAEALSAPKIIFINAEEIMFKVCDN